MGIEKNQGLLLSSWKEIADYLKCDVRTCRRWELTRGLPIHRVEGASKSRIFAYHHELDDWVRGINGPGEAASEKDQSTQSAVKAAVPANLVALGFARRFLFFGIPFIAAISLVFVFLVRPSPRQTQPSDFRIDGSELVILTKNGHELWRYDTHLENLRDDKAYRGRFQTKKYSSPVPGTDLPWIIIRDINRDQKPEVLFCTWAIDEHGGGNLICFSDRGKELWRFQAGRQMWCGSRPYSSEYNTAGFNTVDIDDDGNLEIAVLSHQTPNWLSQLAVLDSTGRVLGEYWNSGQMGDFILADLQADGKKELLIAGLNNEYGKGCLIVFDPRDISGGSPQAKAEFTCRGLKPGTEEYYLLFPRTDVDLELGPVEAVVMIDVQSPNLLALMMAVSGIYFILDFDLAVEDVTLSHGFMKMHHEALLAGRVHSDLNDPRYKEDLMNGVLYYDGRGWVTKPTRVAHPPQ